VSVEGRLQRLELAEGGNPCPACGRPPADDRVVTVVVVKPHARPGHEPEDQEPPAGWRPHREPPRCPRCGRPDEVIREVYEDAQGNLWEPDRVQPQEE
jgi:ribosomal protein S14